MKQIGVDVTRVDSMPVLGTGTRGTALDMGGGKVLKVTNDAMEAKAASVMVGKNVGHIVQFYGVVQLADTGMFAITQEKLAPLSGSDGDAFNKALVGTALPLWIRRAGGSWDKVKEMTQQHIRDQVKKKFATNMNSPDAQAYLRGVNEQWNMLVKTYGIRDMFQTLTENGIDFHDYQAANMMKRGDQFVLIDLGLSKIRANGNITTVAESKRRIHTNMRIRIGQLRQVIREEVSHLREAGRPGGAGPTVPTSEQELKAMLVAACPDEKTAQKVQRLDMMRLWQNVSVELRDGMPWEDIVESYIVEEFLMSRLGPVADEIWNNL